VSTGLGECHSNLFPSKETKLKNDKYPTLLLISTLNKIFGWIALIVGVFSLALAVFGANPIALMYALSSLFVSLVSFAFAEAIIVLVDIEFNTRNGNKAEQQVNNVSRGDNSSLPISSSERRKWQPNCPTCGNSLKEGATGCPSCGFLFSEWQQN
jgi:hypothetical protein